MSRSSRHYFPAVLPSSTHHVRKSMALEKKGNEHFLEQNYEKALEHFNEAYRADASASALYSRAKTYYQMQKYQQAITDLTTLLRFGKCQLSSLNKRGMAYYQLNQLALALEDFNKAIELDSTCAQIYNNRAMVYLKLNNHHAAMNDYAISLEKDPKNSVTQKNLMIVLSDINQTLDPNQLNPKTLFNAIQTLPLENQEALLLRCLSQSHDPLYVFLEKQNGRLLTQLFKDLKNKVELPENIYLDAKKNKVKTCVTSIGLKGFFDADPEDETIREKKVSEVFTRDKVISNKM